MKKIKIISSGNIPSYFAHSINIMKTANGFYRLGYDVEVLSPLTLSSIIKKLSIKDIHQQYGINQGVRLKFFTELTPHFFTGLWLYTQIEHFLMRITTRLHLNFLIKFISFRYSEYRIARYCEQEKPDFIYCRSYKSAQYAIRKGIRTFVESHNPDINNLDLLCLAKLSVQDDFAGIVTVTQHIKESFLTIGFQKEKVLVIEDCVDLPIFERITDSKQKLREELHIPKEKKIILYAGSLHPDKGIGSILEANTLLTGDDVEFIILGGDNKQIRFWNKHTITNNLKSTGTNFLGFKTGYDIPKYLKAADILIAPYSANLHNALWVSPLKLSEYLATTNPIIVADLPRLKDMLAGYTVTFYEPDNPQDLANKIHFLCDNYDQIQQSSNTNPQKVKSNSYVEKCKKVADFYVRGLPPGMDVR